MNANLTHLERINLLRHCAGRLQADTDPAARWLGQQLTRALASGRSLDDVTGFRPERGSRATAAAIIRREALDRDIARLVDYYGVTGASQVLRGVRAPASEVADLLTRLRAAGVGTSPSAISRALRRIASHRT